MDSASAPFDRIVVVHGFRASPQKHWFPWLAQTEPAAQVLALPDSATPDAEAWITTVSRAIGTLDARTAVFAHSLGCITTVRAVQRLAAEQGEAEPGTESGAAESQTMPRQHATGPASLGAFIAVSPFAQTLPTTGDEGFDAFAAHGLAPFLDRADLPGTRPHLGRVTVIRSNDDPLVVPALSDAFARDLEARVQVIPGARHFLEPHGVTQLPEVLRALEGSAAAGA